MKHTIILFAMMLVLVSAHDNEEEIDYATQARETELADRLRQEISRRVLGELLWQRLMADGELLAEDGGDESSVNRVVAKRFPKWRTGDTKSRVKLLNLDDFSNPRNGEYSNQLRKIWENNMLEKNKMYNSFFGKRSKKSV
mgnify:CR=1 FL=1